MWSKAKYNICKVFEELRKKTRLNDIGNEQRYDQSIKGALISNGIVHDEVVDVIQKYIIDE